MEDRLYFRQLLSGRDFATDNMIAQQMVNFAYMIGDRKTGEVVLVDPAYNIDDLLALAEADGMTVTGVLGTHYHADHVGGNMMGHAIIGVAELLEKVDVPIHLQAPEVEFVTKTTGLGPDQLVAHASGDVVSVGSIAIELIHTPGHTPGSQCFLVRAPGADHDAERLVSGDTLFLDGCGRTDLPGGDAEQLYYSLTDRLSKVPDSALLYPGHLYSPPETHRSMGDTRARNVVYKPGSVEQWMMMFGH